MRRQTIGTAGVVAVALAAMALVGCGDSGGEPDTDAFLGAWVLTDGTHEGAAIPIVDGARITMTIEPGSVGGTAACNGYGGSFRSDGRAFRIDELGMTDMGCEPPIQASEQAYLAALPDVRSIDLVDGQLVLSGNVVRLAFDRLAPVPDAELVGTTWEMDTIIDGPAASSVAGDRATLTLRPDGTLVGGTGCRSLSGTWIINGDEVLFPNFGADGECPAELARQDGHVVEVLGDGFTVQIDGDRLTVTSRGNLGLSYRRVETDS